MTYLQLETLKQKIFSIVDKRGRSYSNLGTSHALKRKEGGAVTWPQAIGGEGSFSTFSFPSEVEVNETSTNLRGVRCSPKRR